MKITTEEFRASFHSLAGTTIGERRKNLFLLLNTAKSADIQEIDFSKIQPQTSLEEKFKIDTLIFFKQVPLLLEVLKSENIYLIERILKDSSWLFESAFQNVSAAALATHLLPRVSMKAKLKVINKLAVHLKNHQQADDYFKAIEATYGLHLASKLLPACSLGLITQYLTMYKLKLTPRQLMIVIKRHPQNVEAILKIVKSNDDNFSESYTTVFLYLARNNVNLFLKLRKQYNLRVKIGWRITERFALRHKMDVLAEPSKYYEMLKGNQISKTLQKDFHQYYAKFFPASINQFGSSYKEVLSILKRTPKKIRNVDLLFTTFEKLYGVSLWTCPDLLQVELLEMMLPEGRAKLNMELKPKTVSEEVWYCFYKVDVSIPYLKKRISLSSDIATRVSLVVYLVDTCKFNNDKVALASVCQYMVNKHRNDHVSVRGKFLKAVASRFDLMELEEVHWNSINELIQIFALNKESLFQAPEYITAFIYFRLKNGLPIREQLASLLKEHGDGLEILQKYPKYQKECMLLSYELSKEIQLNYVEPYAFRFCKSLIKWNQKYPEDEISLFSYPEILGLVKERLREDEFNHGCDDIMKFLFKNKFEQQQTQELVNMYLSLSTRNISGDILNWIAKYRPLLIVEHLAKITDAVITKSYWRDDYFFWIFCKNYTHLSIPEKMIPICLEKHECSEGAIVGLSHLMKTQEFINFANPYCPTNLRADPNTQEGKQFYETQMIIAKFVNNVKPTSAVLDTVLSFCKGDYLKMIRKSLYSVLDTTNEDKLKQFLTKITDSAVSVRKHAMHLTFRLMDKKEIFEVLSKFMEKEKNSSIRKFLFKGIFNYFSKNPDVHSWELVKKNVVTVDADDKEALEILMETGKIPAQFLVQYLVFTWEFLERLPSEGSWSSQKNTLLNLITSDVIKALPEAFCEGILDKYLFKDVESGLTFFQSTIQTFACVFIIYFDKDRREQRLLKYFGGLKSFVDSHKTNRKLKNDVRNFSANFLKEFSLQFLKCGCEDTEIMLKFADEWNKFFQPITHFKEYLYLNLVLIYVQKLPVDQIGEKVGQLFDHAVETYGATIIELFNSNLLFFQDHFLKNVPKEEFPKLDLIDGIVSSMNNSVHRLLLGVLMVKALGDYADEKESPKYEKIVDLIRANSEPIVQIYLSSYLGGDLALNYA